MKVLIIGGGGREHALAWKLAVSPRVHEVVVAPGNPGMVDVARTVSTSLAVPDLLALAQRERPDLTVIGPEAPLVEGVVDALEGVGLRVFGPNAAAARLEGSKRHAKEFMQRHRVSTAAFATFREEADAQAYLDRVGAPIVVKDSALAAGKGVAVAQDVSEAREAVSRTFARGPAEVVIEELLLGQELSLLVFTDGETYRIMPLAQDHKQALDGDLGPMTGGMGTVAPASLLSASQQQAVMETVVEPTLRGLKADGVRYRGVLYFGLMLNGGRAKVLEFNVRFGDPETQVVLPLLRTDLLDVLDATVGGRLAEVELAWSDRHAACVVMAAPGYPGAVTHGVPITVPSDLGEHVRVFHAGTGLEGGRLVATGGRVLNVVGFGDDLSSALDRAYAAVDRIDFPGALVRRDIGRRLLTL